MTDVLIAFGLLFFTLSLPSWFPRLLDWLEFGDSFHQPKPSTKGRYEHWHH